MPAAVKPERIGRHHTCTHINHRVSHAHAVGLTEWNFDQHKNTPTFPRLQRPTTGPRPFLSLKLWSDRLSVLQWFDCLAFAILFDKPRPAARPPPQTYPLHLCHHHHHRERQHYLLLSELVSPSFLRSGRCPNFRKILSLRGKTDVVFFCRAQAVVIQRQLSKLGPIFPSSTPELYGCETDEGYDCCAGPERGRDWDAFRLAPLTLSGAQFGRKNPLYFSTFDAFAVLVCFVFLSSLSARVNSANTTCRNSSDVASKLWNIKLPQH